MLQKYNDSLPHSVDVLYFVKLENWPCLPDESYRGSQE
jgi:hypothetical protein